MTDSGHQIRPLPSQFTPGYFDVVYEAEARSRVIARLAEEAFGDEYPSDVAPYGMTTTKWLLGRLVSETKLGPGNTCVDLACGRGGPGLWLARATGSDLIGVDWSETAIRLAEARIAEFLPEGRAQFVVGDLTASGLPDGCADAVICIDGVFFASDMVTAMAEAGRLLRPRGRYVFTIDVNPDSSNPARHVVDEHVLDAGLDLLGKEVMPDFAELLRRLYARWLKHADEIAAEAGRAVANQLVEQAQTVVPTLPHRAGYLVTARKPA